MIISKIGVYDLFAFGVPKLLKIYSKSPDDVGESIGSC